MNGPRILIMAGGTGGHIFPGLAVARSLREQGASVRWMGSRGGMEARLVPGAGVELDLLSISGLRGKGAAAMLAAPWRLTRAVAQAWRCLSDFRPGAVLSMGGFAAGPGGLAAWLRRIPLLVHEQNSIAGWTNRGLARLARVVMNGFPGSLKGRREVFTGNPVRPEIAALVDPAKRLADRRGAMRLLVIGGSRGAAAINQVLPAAVSTMTRPIRVRHQCGAGHQDVALQAWKDAGVEPESLAEFIDDMPEALSWADLVMCRAGALTLAELAAAGLGSLLVPYPHAVDDHQTHNASAMVAAGAGILLPQAGLTARDLAQRLDALANAPERRLEMALGARTLARPDAAEAVAELCLEVAHGA